MALRAVARPMGIGMGPQGPPGPSGPEGVEGPPGTQGPAGPPGQQGNQGPPGQQGPPGEALPAGLIWLGDYAVNTAYAANDVVQYGTPPASYWAVQAVPANTPPSGDGTANAYWAPLSMQGPQGQQGPPGSTGAPGAQGPQGAPGTPGAQGPAGPQGLQGTPGGSFPDAPSDGTLYGRWNGQWEPVDVPPGIPEAPPDGQSYLRNGLQTEWLPGLPLSGGTLTGSLIIPTPNQLTIGSANNNPAQLNVGGQGISYLALGAAGSNISFGASAGTLTAYQAGSPIALASQAYVQSNFLPLTGGTLVPGSRLTLGADPVGPLDAVTLEYLQENAGNVTISDTPPTPYAPGDMWFDSVGVQLYIWYDDGTSAQWVAAASAPGQLLNYLPLTGGALTGPLSVNASLPGSQPAPLTVGGQGINYAAYGAIGANIAFAFSANQLYVYVNGTAWGPLVTLNVAQTTYLQLVGGTMGGPIVLAGNASQPLNPVTLQQLQAGYAPLAGATFTGPVTLPTGSTVAGYLPLAGGTVTGSLTVDGQLNNPWFSSASGGIVFANTVTSSISCSSTINASSTIQSGGAIISTAAFQTSGMTGSAAAIQYREGSWLLFGFGSVGATGPRLYFMQGGAGTTYWVPYAPNCQNLSIYGGAGGPTNVGLGLNDNTAGSYTIYVDISDARIKDNIAPTSVDALSVLAQIPVEQFDVNGRASAYLAGTGKSEQERDALMANAQAVHVEIGLVAQHLMAHVPEAVGVNVNLVDPYPDDHPLPVDCHNLHSTALVPYLVKAIQQLAARLVAVEDVVQP